MDVIKDFWGLGAGSFCKALCGCDLEFESLGPMCKKPDAVVCACNLREAERRIPGIWGPVSLTYMAKSRASQWQTLYQTKGERDLRTDTQGHPLTFTCAPDTCVHMNPFKLKTYYLRKILLKEWNATDGGKLQSTI